MVVVGWSQWLFSFVCLASLWLFWGWQVYCLARAGPSNPWCAVFICSEKELTVLETIATCNFTVTITQKLQWARSY
jgi:hypothetical protein